MGLVTAQVRNIQQLRGELKKLREASEKAIRNTMKDMKARAPGWVAAEVTNVYSIKKSEVTPVGKKPQKKAGTVSLRGETIDTLQLVYTGRLLTPTHFKMKPGSRPLSTKDASGRTTKRAKAYSVSAEIKKGTRRVLGAGVFLGSNRGAGEIPFQRQGRGRLPIASVKTLSMPQMITSDKVAPKVEAKLADGLKERFEHNMKRAAGK